METYYWPCFEKVCIADSLKRYLIKGKEMNLSRITTMENTTSILGTVNNNNNTQLRSVSSMDIALAVLFLAIFFIGTTGNGVIIYYFGIQKRRKKRRLIPEVLFFYLAIVDFGASCLNPLTYSYWSLTSYHWHLGYWACKIILPLGPILTTMSGGIFIIIAFDRQRTIVHPFKQHYNLKYVNIFVMVAFIFSVLLNFHYGVNLELVPGPKCLVPNAASKRYSIPTIFTFLVQDITLIFVFAFTNCRIFSHLRSEDTARMLGALWQKRKKDSGRIIRLLIVLATVFFMLTLPRDALHFVFILSWYNGRGIAPTPAVLTTNLFLKVLHTSNSCANVFVYYLMHKGFRNQVNRLICFWTKTQRKQNLSEITNTETLIDEDCDSPNSFPKSSSILRKFSNKYRKSSKGFVVRQIDIRVIDEANIGLKRTTCEGNTGSNKHIVRMKRTPLEDDKSVTDENKMTKSEEP